MIISLIIIDSLLNVSLIVLNIWYSIIEEVLIINKNHDDILMFSSESIVLNKRILFSEE